MGRKKAKPKAYSYLRFSTPEQGQGDSRRRQLQLAEKYAAKHGLVLDDELRMSDEGVSAFRAKNVRQGALGKFLEAIDDGLVAPGSFLLVESLDRISRANPWDAMPVFQQIINADVSIVTLQDERVWSRDELANNPFRIFESLMVMIRAHEESATKGRRVRDAWEAKRRKAAETPLTARGPSWLRLDRTKTPPKWRLIPDRVRVVRRVYRMAARGIGQHSIAHTLNQEGVPTFGRGKLWHRSFVKKLLESEAVVGVYTPHTQSHDVTGRRVRTPGEPVPNYYPRIIDDDLFNDVQAMRLGGRRQPSPKGTRRPTHMLAGIARCGLCEEAMTRVYKGPKGGKPKLVCTKAKVGAGCSYQAVNVEDVERAIRDDIAFLIGTAPTGDEGLDAEMERLETTQEAIDEMLRNIADSIALGGDSATLRDRMRALEAERERCRKEHNALLEKIEAASRASVEKRLAKAHDLIAADAERAEINAVLRQLLKAVVVDRKNGRLRFEWQHGGESELNFAWPMEDAEG
ncbi:recombinase family protein [Hyphomicrobium sp.]|uniref:recombinase family protein n=1 Tax=Hyphomicrobium sp. TaxID=82 RepID=UPI002FE0C616